MAEDPTPPADPAAAPAAAADAAVQTAEEAVDEIETLVDEVAARTAGRIQRESFDPLSQRLDAFEKRLGEIHERVHRETGIPKVEELPGKVQAAAPEIPQTPVEAEETFVKPKRRHPFLRLPRGL